MHIEFDLNGNLGGPWRSEIDQLKDQIMQWATIYEVRFQQRTVGLLHRLILESESDITLFQLTWNHRPYRLAM